jgi:hypothetical protein
MELWSIVGKVTIDKQSLFGRGGHIPLKTVLKQRFHGPEHARIGLDSQDRGRSTSAEESAQESGVRSQESEEPTISVHCCGIGL